jgi:TolB protein
LASNSSSRSGERPVRNLAALRVVTAAAVLAALLLPMRGRSQTDVKTGIKASGTVKSPLLLASFRSGSGAGGPAQDAHDVVRHDLDLSGVFAVADVEPLAKKLEPDPSAQGAVRVEGLVEQGGDGFQFTGEVFDLATAESMFKRTYPFHRADARAAMHRFVDDVLEALTGERGICETKIAFIRSTGRVKEVWVMDYDGMNPSQLTHDRSIALSPAWAPWGTELAFTTYKRGNPDIYLFDLRRGASYPFSTRPGPNIAPSYSPDGKWIACSLYRDGNAEIYLISRDAQTAKRLTRNPRIDSGPCFSPSGGQVAFSSDRSGSPQIYVMDSEGVNQRLLTGEGKYNDSPRWSPKGDRITYAARHDGIFDVVVMDSNGRRPFQITSGAGHNENPQWSADGRKIYFSSTRSGRRQVYMVNADGSDVVQLTRGDECFNPAAGPRPRRAGVSRAG